jgi:mannose-6-phosphate isomerase-like protein (cupin superfamily)
VASPFDPDRLVAAPLAEAKLGAQDGAFVIVEWTDPGTGDWEWIAPLHVHHSDDEAWYVLAGSLRFRLGEEVIDAESGTGVFAPHGTPHAYGNVSGRPARYLLVMTPAIHRLIEELHAPAPPGQGLDYREIFRKHDSELL